MLPGTIYDMCKKLGLEKHDINIISTGGMPKSNLLNHQIVTADLYKAGTRYGTVSINEF